MAGSGKSTAVEYITQKGYPKVYFGGVILSEMEKRGITQNPTNERQFREAFRIENGTDAVANKIIEEILNLAESGQHRVIADGLYSWTEYRALKHAFPGELSLVAIVAPRHTRYHRLENRPVRPLTATEAYQRDEAEIENLEKGGPIAIADHYVINDGDVEHLYEQIDAVANDIKFFD